MTIRIAALVLSIPFALGACSSTTKSEGSDQIEAIAGHHIDIGVTPGQAWAETAVQIYSKGGGSSLMVEVFEEGTGAKVQNGDQVSVHYRGWVLGNEVQFDSSFDRNEKFNFMVGGGRVIKGWDVGVEGLTVGTRARLHIAPEFGYGERDLSPDIPANSTLIFDVQVFGVN